MLDNQLMIKGRRIDPALPYIIFSVINISMGSLTFLLPETTGVPLPMNVKEAVDMEK